MSDSCLTLRAGTARALSSYVASQLHHMFPDGGFEADLDQLNSFVPRALERMRPILAAVRNFEPDRFDHFHTLQYATFLYCLGNERWIDRGRDAIADRLYALNRALNSIDLFYAVNMPEVFFLSHALGAVLGNANYGTRLVVFQGVTVGRVGEKRPVLGSDVVLYPGAQVTGSAQVGDRCVVGAGVHVSGISVPADSIVAPDKDGKQIVRPRTKDYVAQYLRRDVSQ